MTTQNGTLRLDEVLGMIGEGQENMKSGEAEGFRFRAARVRQRRLQMSMPVTGVTLGAKEVLITAGSLDVGAPRPTLSVDEVVTTLQGFVAHHGGASYVPVRINLLRGIGHTVPVEGVRTETFTGLVFLTD